MPDDTKPSDDYGQTVSDVTPARLPPPPSSGDDPYGATVADGGSRPPSRLPGATYGSRGGGGGRTGSAFSTFGDAAGPPTVERELGRGGMGIVQLVHEPRLRRYVAYKRINTDLIHDQVIIDRFLAEAQAAAKLSNFHIVQVYDIDEDDDGPLIRMEYVPGPYPAEAADGWRAGLPNPPLDLEKYVKRNGKLPLDQAIRLIEDVCSGVGVAHRAGVVHRDIKPANILLTDELRPKLGDFGLARHDAAADDAADAGRTMPGARLLTIGYGAPEQETDASKVDHRADVYALGATLFFAATGQPPRLFRESDVPEPIRAVVLKAMEKDRERRYQSAKELADALGLAGTRAKMSGGGTATTETTGGPAVAGTLAVGVCYHCGHFHGGDADSRKFCGRCGEPLQVPCLACDAANPIWTKFCGQCRADTMAKVAERSAEFAAAQGRIESELNDFAIDAAKTATTAMLDTVDPRLADFRTWAKTQREGPIKDREATARKLLADAAAGATAFDGQQRYLAAIAAIDALPAALRPRLREPSIHRGGGAAVLALREKVAAKRDRVYELEAEINAAIKADRYHDLRGPIGELESLQADHATVAAGRTFVGRREVETEQSAFSTAMNAKGPAPARAYVATYGSRPELAGPRLAQVRHHYQATLRPAARRAGFKDPNLQAEYLLKRTPAQANADRRRAVVLMVFTVAVQSALFAAPLGAVVGGLRLEWWTVVPGVVVGLMVFAFQHEGKR